MVVSCILCKMTFNNKSCLNRHFSSVHGNDRFECGECGKHFKRKDSLQRHIIVHIQQKQYDSSAPQLYTCTECEESFHQWKHLLIHLRTHGRFSDVFKCADCGQCFTRKHSLTKHLESRCPDKGLSTSAVNIQPLDFSDSGDDDVFFQETEAEFQARMQAGQLSENFNRDATTEILPNNARTNEHQTLNKDISAMSSDVDSVDEDRKWFPLLKKSKQSPSDDESSTSNLENKRKLPETEETQSLSTSELERLVLLEQLRFYRDAGRFVQSKKDQQCKHCDNGTATTEMLLNIASSNKYHTLDENISKINADVVSYSDEDRKWFPLIPLEKKIKQSPSDDESSTSYIEKKTKLSETEETKRLSSSELERLVLLERLQFNIDAGKLLQLKKY